MRRSFLLLAALLLAPATGSAADEAPGFVDLAGASVLASPGAPEGLHPFLPGGRAPEPLAWPLPDGPVLVLGLPRTDPAARDLSFFWDLLAPGEDLHGGYLVAAWHDGTRPIGVILADDAAALYAARFELESAPPSRATPSLDFTKPPAEAGLALRRGRHAFRPRFRIRALYPHAADETSVLDAVATHANRYWFEARDPGRHARLLPRLRRHGVEPVLVADVHLAAEAVARLRPWVVDHGIRHVALRASTTLTEADLRETVLRLRERYDLEELVVLHESLRLADTYGIWPPPLEPPILAGQVRFTLEEARQARASSPGPLLFVETWAQASLTPVPSRPRGRPPELARWFDGVVVWKGWQHTGHVAVLEDAWRHDEDDREEWEDVLLPLLPRGPMDASTFLRTAAERMAAADRASHHAVAWLRPLATDASSRAERLAAGPARPILLVPRVPIGIHADGRLDEPAWGHAATLDLFLPEEKGGRTVRLLAFADGRRLHVAVRGPADRPGPWLQLGATIPRYGPAGVQFGGAGQEAHTRASGVQRGGAWAWRREGGRLTWEGTLDHYDLRGDAHPTRVFDLHAGSGASRRRVATLVLGP